MDISQTDHLKAYGMTFHALQNGGKADWLLNYRGGSFLLDYSDNIATECRIEGVSFTTISAVEAARLYAEVQSDAQNTDVVRLEKSSQNRRVCTARIFLPGTTRSLLF